MYVRLFLAVNVIVATIVGSDGFARGEVVTFESLSLSPDSAAPGDASQMPFVASGVTFNRTYSEEFNCCPGAWAYSNQRDLQTAGVDNAYSAYALPAGGGVDDSDIFAVANNFSRGEAIIDFPAPATLDGFFLTNSTYTYKAVVEGDDGAGFVSGPFASGDFLRLDIWGLSEDGTELGKVETYLADYRDGKSDALSQWTWVDLSSIGSGVSQMEFAMESTDVGPFGMNTPAYFAMDDLTFQVVPEPGTWTLAAIACVFLLRLRQQAVADAQTQ